MSTFLSTFFWARETGIWLGMKRPSTLGPFGPWLDCVTERVWGERHTESEMVKAGGGNNRLVDALELRGRELTKGIDGRDTGHGQDLLVDSCVDSRIGGWTRGRAFDDGPLEVGRAVNAAKSRELERNTAGAGRFAKHGYLVGVAAKASDVLLDPEKSKTLVVESGVGGYVCVGRSFWREAE